MPRSGSFETHSKVNDSRREQCHADDFADEVVAQAILFCCLELIALLGSGLYACWETWCQFRVDRRKPIRIRSNRYHGITRRQVKAIVLIFLCLDFVGVRAKIHAETYAMSSAIQSTRRADSAAHFEADHDVASFMERPDLSDLASLRESETGSHGPQMHRTAVHGAVVLGREAEIGDPLRAFWTESAVQLPVMDPLVVDTYFVSKMHRITRTPRRIRFYQALSWQNALLAAWLPSGIAASSLSSLRKCSIQTC